ncbi:MAG: Indole-3-glycerol phosphate synthase [Gemmatimonadetes bacterium]|nr:Indole-3-glycerol phosphate synthase [Gemmatimonadota bacterium]
MQAFSSWTTPGGTLGAILAETIARVDELRARQPQLERDARNAPGVPPLAAALRRPAVAVIAEVKRRSPSKGVIASLDGAPQQATRYAAGGAAAVSILTEPMHFGGSIVDLESTSMVVSIPLIKKDFHIDEIQLLEARASGAAAVLLIARALPQHRLAALTREALELGLDVITEIRTEAELDAALATGTAIIGVNNRDLETLIIDRAASERLIPLIPADRIAVFESGITGAADVAFAAELGADAVLVGSAVSAAADPTAAVAELATTTRRARGAT